MHKYIICTFLHKTIAFMADSQYNFKGDVMKSDFVITSVNRIVMVGKNEYKNKKIQFVCKTISNELIFHFSGQTIVCFNGRILQTEPSTIRFLPAGDVFEYTVDRKQTGDCILISFDADRPISDKAFVFKDIKNNKKIASLFNKAFLIWVAKNDGYYFECISLLYKIFAELQKEKYVPNHKFNLIKPAVDYIGQNLMSGEIQSEKLSEICGISYSYINRIFMEKYGLSPKKYIIQLKINYACELLKDGDFSISSVAEMCGYDNIYYFSRQFKNSLGLSPTDYIKKYKSSK